MTTILLANRLEPLQRHLRWILEEFRYIRLTDDVHSLQIDDCLSGLARARRLDRGDLFRQQAEDFRKKYTEFTSELNRRNRSLTWWAMPFTNKNPLATSLCRDTANFLLIVKLARSENAPLVVVCEGGDLVAQVLEWAKADGIRVINLVRDRRRLRTWIKRHTAAGAVRAWWRTAGLWALAYRYRTGLDRSMPRVVVATLAHPRCYQDDGDFSDAYFGPLVSYLSESGRLPLVLAILVEHPIRQIAKLRHMQPPGTIIPLEAWLTAGAFLSCAWKSVLAVFKGGHFDGPAEIDGTDLRCLVKRAVQDARHSGDYFLNLRVYGCVAALCRRVNVERCIYPFENRSWEKMLLMGARHTSPETRLLGYQHASLTLSHTNFMLGEEEASATPLPDALLTTGAVTKSWIEAHSNFTPGILSAACALRQTSQPEPGPRRKTGPIRVLAALASSMREYVGILALLERAFVDAYGFQLQVRPHPEIPLENLAAIPDVASNFFSASREALADDLEWADVVIYASSTVGLEAVASGIPAVHLDLGDFLDTDPMAGWSEFRWRVHKPDEVLSTLRHIRDMPDEEYLRRQQCGREYAAGYLTPVTAEGARVFWEG